jgi:hypothetical protein
MIITRVGGNINATIAYDVAVGGSGVEVMIADRLLLQQGDLTSNGTQILRIPLGGFGGQRIAIAAHGVGATPTVITNVQFVCGSGLTPVGAGSIAVVGMNASYLGTAVSSSATEAAFGTSVQFIASLARPMRGFGITFNGGQNGVTFRGAMRLVDASGNQLSAALVASSGGSTGNNPITVLSFLPCNIPAGQAVHVQVANFNASALATRNFILYTVH